MPFVPDQPEANAAPKRGRFVPDAAPAAASPAQSTAAPVDRGASGRVADAMKIPGQLGGAALDALEGVPELVTEGVTHLAAKATSGFAGMGGASPEKIKQIQNDYTYEPRTKTAKAIKQGVGAVTEGVSKVVAPIDNAVANLPAGPRTAIEAVEEAAPDIAGLVPGLGAARTAARVGGAAEEAAGAAAKGGIEGGANVRGGSAIERGRSLGLKFRPSDVRAADPSQKVPGLRREGLTQPNDLRRDMTIENQPAITRNAAEELGSKTKNKLEPAEFDRLREAPLATYKKTGDAVGAFKSGDELTAALDGISEQRALDPKAKRAIRAHVAQYKKGDWSGPEALKDISALRRRATALMRSDDVAQIDIGVANRSIADALEEELGRQLTARGDAKLLGEFQAARTSLAKIHDVQSVTKAGQVDAHGLMRLAKRGVPLSGRLKILADVAEAAPAVTRHSTRATGVGNSVKAETFAGMAKDIAKGAARKFIPGMDVSSEAFQSKHFGRQATPTELSYAADAGKRVPKSEPPAPKPPQLGAGDVEYSPTPGVIPSRAQTLSGDLGLAPEPVPGAVELPAAPSRLTADVPPATPTDGLPFTASEPLLTKLAAELGLDEAPPARGADSIDWAPPTMADQLAGELGLSVPELAEQLGLLVDTPQPNMLGSYTRDLSPPLGTAGKPRKAAK